MTWLDPNKTHFVLIGIKRYEKLQPLKATYENFKAMEEVINKILNADPNNVSTHSEQVTTDSVKASLNKIIDNKSLKNVFIYYAGHGLTDDYGGYYLSMSNSENEKITTSNALDLEEIDKIFRNTNLTVILILDCCFSENAFERITQRNQFILASSAKNITSIYPVNQRFSVFTNELIDILEKGIDNDQENICFLDIYTEIYKRLKIKDGNPKPKISNKNEVQQMLVVKNNFKKQKVLFDPKNISSLEKIFTSLSKYNPEIRREREKLSSNSSYYYHGLAELIFSHFPHTISVYLKNIFIAKEAVDTNYCLKFYEQIVQFISYTIVSVLLDLKKEKKISFSSQLDNEIKQIISKGAHLEIKFLQQAIQYLKDTGVTFFMQEIRDSNLLQLILQIESSKEGLSREELKHLLTDLLCSLSFFAVYKMISVRFIEIRNKRYLTPPVYLHEISSLNGEMLNIYERSKDITSLNNFLNSNSILFIRRDTATVTDYLNLWPFVVDSSSFIPGKDTPTLYSFIGKSSENDYLYKQMVLPRSDNEAGELLPKRYIDIDPDWSAVEFDAFEHLLL